MTESDGNEYFIRGYILPRIATKSTQGKSPYKQNPKQNRGSSFWVYVLREIPGLQ
jgi:hypothetical protein